MNKETQPIDRETLLKEANKIIREHEDTLAGIEATGVTQRKNITWLIKAKREVLSSRLSFTSTAFAHAATSVTTIDRRSLPRCR